MKDTGRFETTTKDKIITENGKILKVVIYGYEDPHEEYRIRPKCEFCGEDIGCVCYTYDNSNNPFKEAKKGLISNWCCDNIHCIYKYLKKYNREKYNELVSKYGDDEYAIVEELVLDFPEDDDGLFCGI
jgi:hypothetical protein